MSAFLPVDHLTFEHNYTGSTWRDFTAGVVSASITLREFTGQHTISLVVYDSLMDPSQSDLSKVVKDGDKIRVFAENAAGVSRKMATFRVRGEVKVELDLTKPPGRQSRLSFSARGTGISGVGGVGASSAVGADDVEELSNIITAAPFEIGGDGFGSGTTAPTGSFTESAVVNEASELDLIALSRDSNPGTVVFEDPDGTIQIFDSKTQRTGAATWTIGPDNYSKIDQRFDSSHVINVLTIRYVEKVKTGAGHTKKVEHDHTFKDDASVAKYGPKKKTVTVHKKVDWSDYADKIFEANADPDVVPLSVTIPIRAVSELLPGYADGAYVGNKVTIVAPDGVTSYSCRVSRISHQITSRLWLVQVFLRNQDVIQRPRSKSAAVDTEVGNNPDGTILTAHLDDEAVTTPKLADEAVDEDKIADGSVTGPKLGTDVSDAIDAAQATADGKNEVTYSTSDPSGTPADGDIWFKRSGTLIIGQWVGRAGAWDAVTVDGLVIANIDAGDITTGTLVGITLQGNTIQTDSSGNRMVIRDDGSAGVIEFFTGIAGETQGFLNPTAVGGTKPAVYLVAGYTAAFPDAPNIQLVSDILGQGRLEINSSQVIIQSQFLDVSNNLISYANFGDDVDIDGKLTVLGNVEIDGDLVGLGGQLEANFTDGTLRMKSGTNIACAISTGFASATGASVALLGGGDVVIGVQSYNSTSPGSGNTQNLHAKAIHSWANGLIMEDLSGGGTTGASIGNGGRVVRTTSSRRYKHAIRDLELETARSIVNGFRARTFKRKKPDKATPADDRRYAGAIAEELAEIDGSEPFVVRDDQGRPDGIHYGELAAAVALPVLADHDRRVLELEQEVERLRSALDLAVNLGG